MFGCLPIQVATPGSAQPVPLPTSPADQPLCLALQMAGSRPFTARRRLIDEIPDSLGGSNPDVYGFRATQCAFRLDADTGI